MAPLVASSLTVSARAFVQGSSLRQHAAAPAQRARYVAVRAEGEVEKVEDKPTDVVAPKRSKDTLWLGGIGSSPQSLSYLDQSLPGDVGFDPLGLSDPEGAGVFVSPSWLAYSEVVHARFAMLGAAGMVTPEALGKMGVIPSETALVWFKNGTVGPTTAPGALDVYWSDPFTLFFGMLTLMGFAEMRRLGDYRKPGCMSKQYFLGMEGIFAGSGDPSYPGGQFFNMLNLAQDDMMKMKTREIKNGRLAMIACFGIYIQAIATGTGPVENLLSHISDATHNNFLTTLDNIGTL